MKTYIKSIAFIPKFLAALAVMLSLQVVAQEADTLPVTEEVPAVRKPKPVKNTFNSIWIIDNQTVMVPVKGTFEMDIMHRFGTIKNGYEDFYGFFAPSNIKLGFNYSLTNDLMFGVGITKSNMIWDGFAKYAIFRQTPGKYPVSLTYYVNASYDSREKDKFLHWSDRLMYFHQLMIARKISDKISVQVAPSISHINIVDGYFKYVKTNSTGPDSIKATVEGLMKHQHFAIALSGRYQIKESMAILVNYDQPITKHMSGNPKPNISFGLELSTSAHSFQIFLGNYYFITPQRNNYFNQNKYENGQFLIGFNITRLWNY